MRHLNLFNESLHALKKSTQLAGPAMALGVIAMLSTPAFAVNSFNMSSANDGNYYCYASDTRGNIPKGSQPIDLACCVDHGVAHFEWSQGYDGFTYCYASDARGNSPGGASATDDACCE